MLDDIVARFTAAVAIPVGLVTAVVAIVEVKRIEKICKEALKNRLEYN